MKHILAIVFVVLAVGLLTTCQRANPDPEPEGTPHLKSIAFTDIPPENVSIDQATSVISVLLPASVPSYVSAAVELSDNAEWINKWSVVPGGSLFGCNACPFISLKNKKDLTTQSQVDYRIKAIATASLAPDDAGPPLSYVIMNVRIPDLMIPVLNLYANQIPREARFTNAETGDQVFVKRDSLVNNQPQIRVADQANKLAVYLYNTLLTPGSYRIDLILNDGRVLKAKQPLLVIQGSVDVDYYAKKLFGYRVLAGRNLTIDGYNLFDGSLTLDLLDKQNQAYPLTNPIFDRYGRSIQVPISATLPPGQYVMRIWQNGIKLPYGYCLRVNVLKDEQERPVLGTIGNDPTPCSLRETVAVQRGMQIALSSNLRQDLLDSHAQRAVLKFVSLAGNAMYYGTVSAYNPNAIFTSNILTVPAAVTPGLYSATLQVLDAQNNVVSESEPYGQILAVN